MHIKDVDIKETATAFQGFFRVLRYRLQHRLFCGGMSRELERELFVRGDSVGVLLYDPWRDEVALLRQFRIGCLDNPAGPWVWEVAAGMVKPGESATDVAVREVAEETSLAIEPANLLPICQYYSSPGGTDERLALFCAVCRLDGVGGIHGLPEEGEDIEVKTFVAGDAFNAMLAGEINNAATVIALQWLQLNRTQLLERFR